MSWTRRRLQFVTAGVVVVAWAVVYLAVAPLPYDPATETAAQVNVVLALLLAVPAAV